jgi:hypothetical protein
MSLAYETALSVSTKEVSTRKWRLALGVLGLTMSIGLLMVALLASGYANPIRGGDLILELEQPVLASAHISNGMEFSEVDALPPPPFTIEVSAAFTTNAEWGIWLGSGASLPQWRFLIDRDGYIATGASTDSEWQQFIHAQPDTNLLYLHVSHENVATFRVNEEIAWIGLLIIEQGAEWGLVSSADKDVQWHGVRVYAD